MFSKCKREDTVKQLSCKEKVKGSYTFFISIDFCVSFLSAVIIPSMQKFLSCMVSPKSPPYKKPLPSLQIPWSAHSHTKPPINLSLVSMTSQYALKSPGPLPIEWQYSQRINGRFSLGSLRTSSIHSSVGYIALTTSTLVL